MGWKGKYQQSSHSTWQKSLTVASKATTSVVFYVSSCIPRLFLALPLRLSLFLDTKQAQNCHHHTNQPPKTQTITTPLLLYLKLNHHTTTIAKIQETHTQNHHHQTPGQTHTQTHHHQIRETHTQNQSPPPNPHPNPPPPNPGNPHPKINHHHSQNPPSPRRWRERL